MLLCKCPGMTFLHRRGVYSWKNVVSFPRCHETQATPRSKTGAAQFYADRCYDEVYCFDSTERREYQPETRHDGRLYEHLDEVRPRAGGVNGPSDVRESLMLDRALAGSSYPSIAAPRGPLTSECRVRKRRGELPAVVKGSWGAGGLRRVINGPRPCLVSLVMWYGAVKVCCLRALMRSGCRCRRDFPREAIRVACGVHQGARWEASGKCILLFLFA